MMRKILLLVILVFFCSGVFGVTLVDDFSGYTSSYQIISYTNPANMSITADANTPVFDGLIADGNTAATVPIDVSKNGSNGGGVFETNSTQPIIDITDYNALGRLKAWIFLTDANFDNLKDISYIEFRIGNSSTNYFEYRESNLFTTGEGAVGKQVYTMDLNAPVATTGNPHLNDINFYQVRTIYTTNTKDHNFTLNKIWVEKQAGAFNGVWVFDKNGSTNIGGGLPFNWTNTSEGNGLSLVDTNVAWQNHRSILLATPFNTVNTALNDVTVVIDVNQVDSTANTRILFDYINPTNYSSAYIYRVNSTTVQIGVDQWVNGVKVSDSNNSGPFNLNAYATFRMVTNRTNVKVFINGILAANSDVSSRIDGSIGLESNNGRTHFKNASIVTAAFDTTSPTGRALQTNPPFSIVRTFLLPLLFIIIFIPLVIGGIKNGNVVQVFAGVILLFVIFLLLEALFFS